MGLENLELPTSGRAVSVPGWQKMVQVYRVRAVASNGRAPPAGAANGGACIVRTICEAYRVRDGTSVVGLRLGGHDVSPGGTGPSPNILCPGQSVSPSRWHFVPYGREQTGP